MKKSVKKKWRQERRETIPPYLKEQGLETGHLPAEPQWDLPPYLSLWLIEYQEGNPPSGYWIISGDLPTDHISLSLAGTPRNALKAFALRWEDIAVQLLSGQEKRDLGLLLEKKARILMQWVDDPFVWGEDEGQGGGGCSC